MGEFEAKKSKIRLFYANHPSPIRMSDNRRACLFFLATDEIFLVYRHLSLSVIVKSGTER